MWYNIIPGGIFTGVCLGLPYYIYGATNWLSTGHVRNVTINPYRTFSRSVFVDLVSCSDALRSDNVSCKTVGLNFFKFS